MVQKEKDVSDEVTSELSSWLNNNRRWPFGEFCLWGQMSHLHSLSGLMWFSGGAHSFLLPAFSHKTNRYTNRLMDLFKVKAQWGWVLVVLPRPQTKDKQKNQHHNQQSPPGDVNYHCCSINTWRHTVIRQTARYLIRRTWFMDKRAGDAVCWSDDSCHGETHQTQ